MNKKTRKTHSRETKLEAVRQVKNSNKTVAQVAEELKLDENMLRRWCRDLQIRDDIIDHIHDAIIVTDTKGNIVTWNHGAETQLGYKASEIIGRPIYLLYPNTENRSMPQDKLVLNLKERGEIHFEAIMQKKSGENIFAHSSISPKVDGGDNITGIISYTLDITEQKRNEERLRQQAKMIDYIHDAVIVTDIKSTIRQWNKGAERQLGYTKEEAIGQPIYLVYPETKEKFNPSDLINILNTQGTLTFESIMQKKSGEKIIVHTSLSPIIDIDKNIAGIISYTLDITEQRNAEKTRLEKERTDNELKIAHDIQMNMVPSDFPLFEYSMGVDLYACLLPAKGVGGDLYDAFSIDDDSVFFTVGDVAGKSVPAALMMARTVTLIRTLARQLTEPDLILEQANNELCRNNEQCMFVTLICGVLNRHSGKIKYANAGHTFPLLVDEDGKSTFIELPVNMPLALMENTEYETFELELSPCNKFILYSDGVTEAFNSEQEQFGDERLLQSTSKDSIKTAKLLVEELVSDVKNHAGDAEQSDDMVVMTIQWLDISDELTALDEQTLSAVLDEIRSQSIKVSNNLEEYPRVVAFFHKFCHEHHISRETKGSLQLILEESVTNVMKYAYPSGIEGSIKILLKANSEWFSITLFDGGKAFNPLKKDMELKAESEEEDITASRAKGGMGIKLIKANTDKIEYNYTEKGNRLNMWVRIT
jgi:PAS domain S-box-containing protein